LGGIAGSLFRRDYLPLRRELFRAGFFAAFFFFLGAAFLLTAFFFLAIAMFVKN